MARPSPPMAAAASAMGVKVRPQCFFDIEINREPVGRITFQLFSDVCQKTCNNFLYLCTGEKGIGKSTGKKLCYKGSTFHRVVKNFMIQGGDFTEGNGKGGESIYGGYFKDENFILKHDRAFLLSMANRGKHTNGSQFFITTRAAPHLDNVHVVFGLVISGFEVIETIENLKTDAASRPYADVRVIDCGLIQTQPSNEERIPKLTLDPEAFVSENVMKVLSVPPVSENITNTLPIPETSVSKRILKVTPALEAPIAKKIAKPAHTSVPSNAKKIIKVPPVPELSVSENIPKVLNIVEASPPRIIPKDHSGSDQSDSSSKSATSSENSFSESELEVEKGRRKKRKRKTKLKAKHTPKRRKDERRKEESRREDRRKDEPRKGEKGKEDRNQKRSANHKRHADKNGLPEDLSKDLNLKREKLVVRPEEIPPVPENKFLLRRDVPVPAAEPEPKPVVSTPGDSDQKPSISKSGRKIKGRGTMRYHTPPRSRSCSESEDDDQSSETPPHWKEEMQRVRAYKPTSGVKWSKGDKLKEGHGRDERNRSQRSRSRSWSHDGFYSDLSKDRYCNVDNNRKERKAKHKKKSKKQKQPRNTKPLKTEVPFVTEVVASHSSVKRRKYFRDQEKRSSSLSSSMSSKHSSKREWCKSDKEQSFSSSSARKSRSHSKSRSRSYSREHSRSRTASKSTSRSRNRSRSLSRSRSQSRTRSRSRSRTRSRSRISTRSRSKSRSNSKSRRHGSVSRSPRKNSTQPIENKTKQKECPRPVVQQNDKPPVLPPPESIPLIPLSDSPPPSRWKPGLKPWKPSYERIQEIKTKPCNVEPLKSSSTVSQAKQKYLNNKTQVSSDSEQSDRSTHYTRKSKSRSTSRSYTRSFSRSRSRSSSRSISPSSATSQSQQKYLSANSSYYKSSSSNSDEDERHNVQRKNTPVPKTKENSSESLLNRQTTIDSNEARDPCQEVEKSVTKIESPEGKERKNILQKTVLDLSEKPIKEEESSLEQHSNDEYINRQSVLVSKPDSTCISEKKEITDVNDDPVQSSGKEEGEASSDSEAETVNFKSDTKTRSELPKIQPPLISDNSKNRESSSDSNVANLVSENHREKSKKHKHRSSKKTNKKAHLKKSKEKSKLKKEQKHKLQKRKPAFLWQPPLEYGEEDDEEVDEGVIVKPLPKTGKNDKLFQSETHKSEDKSKKGKKAKSEPVPNLKSEETLDRTSSSNISNPATLAKPPVACETSKHSKVVTDNDSKSDDNMDICTPDHTSSDNDTEDLACIIDTKAAAVITGNGKLLTDGSAKTDPLNQAKSGKEAENVKVNITGGKSNTLLPLVLSVNSHKQPEKDANAQSLLDNKWKPVQGPSNIKAFIPPSKTVPVVLNAPVEPESKPQGVRIEIKSKNRVKPGSLFDEVRKTARLNRRPRNQESSSEESSEAKSPSRSRSRSRGKSRSRTRSHSYSHSRSRSRSSSSSSRSRSYSRSRSRRRHSRKRRRGHSSSSDRYRSQSRHYTRSRSRSRSRSYSRHRRSSRSRSYTYDSYSRSRSRSKRSYSRSRSYDRRSRSRRSYRSSRSDRSYSYSGSSTDG